MKPWLICSSRNAVTTSACSVADGELPADEGVFGFARSPILKPCCKPVIMCVTHSLSGWSRSALSYLGMSSGVLNGCRGTTSSCLVGVVMGVPDCWVVAVVAGGDCSQSILVGVCPDRVPASWVAGSGEDGSICTTVRCTSSYLCSVYTCLYV